MAENDSEGGDSAAADGGGISSEIESLRRQLADAKRMLSAAKEGSDTAGAKGGAGGAPKAAGGRKAAGGKAAAGPPGAQAGGGKAERGKKAEGGKKPGAGKAAEAAGKKPEGKKPGAGKAAEAAGKKPEGKKPGAGKAAEAAGKKPEGKKPGAGKKAGGTGSRRGSRKQEGAGKAKAEDAKDGKAKDGKAKDEKPKDRTLEEEMEAQLTDDEIRNFMLEKHDMSRLTSKVCEMLYESEGAGMVQNVLWKKLKLSGKDGARLALKLERRGIIDREKIVEKGRWTYRLILRKSPVSTESIENSPCLTCPVEARCAVDAEVSPLTCTLIESWVMGPAAKGRSGRR